MLTIPTLSFAVLVAILYDQITGYIKLLGGFCSTFIGYVMPCNYLTNLFYYLGMIYIKSNDYPIYHWKNVVTIILAILMATIGFSTGIITLINIINGKGH